jgi:hypothetical protein
LIEAIAPFPPKEKMKFVLHELHRRSFEKTSPKQNEKGSGARWYGSAARRHDD